MLGLGIVIGIFIGAVAWHVGLLNMVAMQRKGGCFRHCEHCGREYDYPLTFALRKEK